MSKIPNSLMQMTLFGFYNEAIKNQIITKFQDKNVIINDYQQELIENPFWEELQFFPHRINEYNISRPSRYLEFPYFFIIDFRNIYDVIDFWNIRALGYKLIPISFQSIKK